jgi:hypothetical protein
MVCALLFGFVFVGERVNNLGVLLESPALPSLVLGGSIVAFVIGTALVVRPTGSVVRWSTFAGIVWFVAFGSLVVTALDQPGPRTSSSLIFGFGVAGALVTYWSRRAVP